MSDETSMIVAKVTNITGFMLRLKDSSSYLYVSIGAMHSHDYSYSLAAAGDLKSPEH